MSACSKGGGGGDIQSITQSQSSADGGSSIWELFGIEDPKVEFFRYDQVPEPYPKGDVAACKAYGGKFKDVHDCACDNCFDLQRQCDALVGCTEIAECAVEIGCTDANTCYLLPDTTKPNGRQCIPIIDKWGNTGAHVAVSNRLGECTVAAKCR